MATKNQEHLGSDKWGLLQNVSGKDFEPEKPAFTARK
jgi:hypothetical protein